MVFNEPSIIRHRQELELARRCWLGEPQMPMEGGRAGFGTDPTLAESYHL